MVDAYFLQIEQPDGASSKCRFFLYLGPEVSLYRQSARAAYGLLATQRTRRQEVVITSEIFGAASPILHAQGNTRIRTYPVQRISFGVMLLEILVLIFNDNELSLPTCPVTSFVVPVYYSRSTCTY